MVLLLSVVFVFVWSTGFIVGKFILPHADPTLFLLVRTALVTLVFAGLALYLKLPWPHRSQWPKHLLAGVLLHGLYLSGTYWAIDAGMPPAVMALIGSLQPLLTAVFGIPLLKEYPSRKVWVGLILGMFGVGLVIYPSVASTQTHAFGMAALMLAGMAILSITFGTLLQKTSISGSDLRVTSAIQNFGCVLFTGVFVLILGESRWDNSMALWGAVFWGVFVLSSVGALLLLWLVRRGQAATASSLMFLAPPLAAIEAFFLFGDRLQSIQLAGFAIALGGVLLCNLPMRRRI
ncbi:MAG: DMT family transporter [Burkholderiaceae bacterium]|jgi:drug/metabolite transporter (DMT)-like permease